MSVVDHGHVVSSADARNGLGATVKRFRLDENAAPVVFGAQRKPEAVIMPFRQYERLVNTIEDLEIAALVAERVGRDEETPLNELLDSLDMGHLKA